MSRVVVRVPIRRYAAGAFTSRPDAVAGEEPLEIRVNGEPLAVTMRTPGSDIDLVHGFLHSEGLIESSVDVTTARYCAGVDAVGQNTYNVLDVRLTGEMPSASVLSARRSVLTTSSCGVCGKATIDALRIRARYPSPAGPQWDPAVLAALPDALRATQQTFRKTGGLHAAAVADAAGAVRLAREDVGRHNAVDKVVGAALLAGLLPLAAAALVTSSRASFELVQKAMLAGIGTLVAVSAPSSLAVELATECGMTLVGFTRDGEFNVYAGASRIIGA